MLLLLMLTLLPSLSFRRFMVRLLLKAHGERLPLTAVRAGVALVVSFMLLLLLFLMLLLLLLLPPAANVML